MPATISEPDHFVGLCFPVVRVRFAGPTDHRVSRYIATVRGVRATHSYNHALSPSENAYVAARKAWHAYQTQHMVNIATDPRIFIPGELSSDAYAFTVVPVSYLAP